MYLLIRLFSYSFILKGISIYFCTDPLYMYMMYITTLNRNGKSEAIYQTFTYFGSLAWNYISSKIPTDVSYICFKNIAKLHLQSNNLPQIRLNV